MSNLLKYKNRLDDCSIDWSESDMQCRTVTIMRRLEEKRGDFTFAGDQNAEKRSPRQGALKKAEGMRAGETDLRFYLSGARTILIELKKENDGEISDVQHERHAKLRELGFQVHVVWGRSPAHAALEVQNIIMKYLEGDK